MDAYIVLIIFLVCITLFGLCVFLCREFNCLGTETKTVEKYEYSSQSGTLPCTMALPQQPIIVTTGNTTDTLVGDYEDDAIMATSQGLDSNISQQPAGSPPSHYVTEQSITSVSVPDLPRSPSPEPHHTRSESPLLCAAYSSETESESSSRPPRPPKPEKFTTAYYRQGFYKSSAV